MNRRHLIIVVGALCWGVATPSVARMLGGERPVIVVRSLPASAAASVYLVYAGGLDEMLVAEQAAAKALLPRGIRLLPASADISDISELSIKSNQEKMLQRTKVDPTCVVVFISGQPVGGEDIRFKMKILTASGTDLAAGEVVINTGKQMTFDSGAAKATRIAIRDATTRLFSDNRVLTLLMARKP